MKRQQILTVVVEDYYHVAALRGAIREKHWDRLEPRLQEGLTVILEMLRRHEATATFFVYGLIAERHPQLVQQIVADGHEVASRGYAPRRIPDPPSFREELARAKQALEAAGANPILGYRAARWLQPDELWQLEVLAEEGYAYDSSINPVLRRFADAPEMQRIHRHDTPRGSLWEFPIATVGLGGVRLTISGGNYVRQLPHRLMSRLVAHKSAGSDEPLVFYLMTWELDPAQPDIQGIETWQRIRHYRRLGKPRWVFNDYLERYAFVGIADHLGLPHPAQAPSLRDPAPPRAVTLSSDATPVTLVIPLYNEEKTLAYLRRTLADFRGKLSDRYRVHLLLVDDGSSDDTLAQLRARFADMPDCTIVEHGHNRGVAAAIMTGIRAAPTEIVCSIDCDLSYDPRHIAYMLDALGDADMVTASPYHPDGQVLGVPPWRLFLSKTLSRMYSAVLDARIYTYTSCCRVYRKSAVAPLELHNDGFLGVAEMLIALIRSGGRVAELPAVLESRLLGESKMKIGRTIAAHLGLLRDLAQHRP